MDSIIIAFKTAMGIPLIRILFIAWCVLFVFICLLSIATARVPSRRLYKAGKDKAKKAPLDAIIENYKEHPEKWLLYEEEIFYVKDPEELTGEDLEAYERARARCVDGGKEARQVGSRIRVGRTETQAYLRFFYSLHKERKPKDSAVPFRGRRTKNERYEEEERVEEIGEDEAAALSRVFEKNETPDEAMQSDEDVMSDEADEAVQPDETVQSDEDEEAE